MNSAANATAVAPVASDTESPIATSPPSSSLPRELEESILVTYRSVGIGTFGVVMRWAGMPLEKIALYMNSSQVSGKNQFAQSIRLTFKEGASAPYRVVGPASLVAWFMQYSVMGMAFQFFDHALSKALDVKPVYYGDELMQPPAPISAANEAESKDSSYRLRSAIKTLAAPLLAGTLESIVANRAEVQRYFGPTNFAAIESKLGWGGFPRMCGPAFGANIARNFVMCNTSFIMTPITYKLYFPQEKKTKSSLFWYGMSMNFAGNAVAITQQALWGRSLDYCAQTGGRNINYIDVVRTSLKNDGTAAFFTVPKWSSRILMNAPVQGSLPWFYNHVLPMGEPTVMRAARRVASMGNMEERGPSSALQ